MSAATRRSDSPGGVCSMLATNLQCLDVHGEPSHGRPRHAHGRSTTLMQSSCLRMNIS
jgi:hypothetical protein